MEIILLVLIGLSAGIASGLFGIGGGVIIVPALLYLLKFPVHRAIGTSLAALLLPIGAAAAFTYFRAGHVDIRAAIIIALTLFAGAWGGAMIATRLDSSTLRILMGLFLIALGVYTLLSHKG
ncbi:hypothetical protein SAMN05660284_01006 [Formivibrio citricus]|uniref:Probable membrane transporter protein n=2 Tax=Formivibrio citricus TaxID=83765 RepID=A0A1I4XFF3_9NEIS|nr:hypothetical protein SAMN05660284_01006 [Formivibrio citricus]